VKEEVKREEEKPLEATTVDKVEKPRSRSSSSSSIKRHKRKHSSSDDSSNEEKRK
jgi:hypothetical protein